MTDAMQPLRHPRISVPTDNPDDRAYFVQPGTGYDGVVAIARGGVIECTGALLYSGRHILTAAHCFNLDEVTPNLDPNESEYTVFFDLPGGRVPVAVSQIFINPEWSADSYFNHDIAVIELAESAPETAERYQIYTNGDEIFQTITRVGYGSKGTGNTGEVELDANPIKRQGLNRYDAFADRFNRSRGFRIIPGTQLAYDFDNGLRANDAFGQDAGIFDPGFGLQEVASTPGDSGGPSLIDGKLAGVVSYGFTAVVFGTDVTNNGSVLEPKLDSSFGEFFVDTRVAVYAGFIADRIAQTNQGDDLINGNNQDDLLTGNAGNDRIDGRAGNDLLFGNQGNDAIEGREGDDLLVGGRDSDTISGGDGNDSLAGNLGNDGLNGDRGNDLLFGGQGDDILTGGDGNDRLSGDLGRDILIGGLGSDELILRTAAAVFDPNQADIIADFVTAEDRIALTGVTPSEGEGLVLPEGLVFVPTTLAGLPGTLIQLPAGPPETPPEQLLPTILGFVSNAAPADVAARLVPISDIV